MAIFKNFSGNREDLNSTEKVDGQVYFINDGSLHFDYKDSEGNLQRSELAIEKDIPIITGSGKDSIVQRDLGNTSVGEASQAFGINTTAGSKAFTIIGLNTADKIFTLDSVEGLEIGDTYSCHVSFVNGSRQFENIGMITAIDGNTVAVDVFPVFAESLGEFKREDNFIDETGLDMELNAFRIIAKPFIGTRTIGYGTSTVGIRTQALSKGAHSEGCDNISHGSYAHTEGTDNKAGYCAHAEGRGTTANGFVSHAEGQSTAASGVYSHAEGTATVASGQSSHVEGYDTIVEGDFGHAEGEGGYRQDLTTGALSATERAAAVGVASHIEGSHTHAEGKRSHAEGYATYAEGISSHAEGHFSYAQGQAAHAEGGKTKALAEYSHAEGVQTNAEGRDGSHAEGFQTIASGDRSHAEGSKANATNIAAHAEGGGTTASGTCSHAEGNITTASGNQSHAEGFNSKASNNAAHAEGGNTTASGDYAHAEGNDTSATNIAAHAEGMSTKASAQAAHAEGLRTQALAPRSHAEGTDTVVNSGHTNSHAGGQGTKTSRYNQTVVGEFNADSSDSLFIVGNGSGADDAQRSNAFTVQKDGRATIGAAPVNPMDAANKKYVDDTVAANKDIELNLKNGLGEGSLQTDKISDGIVTAEGVGATAFGNKIAAYGNYSHAEGFGEEKIVPYTAETLTVNSVVTAVDLYMSAGDYSDTADMSRLPITIKFDNGDVLEIYQNAFIFIYANNNVYKRIYIGVEYSGQCIKTEYYLDDHYEDFYDTEQELHVSLNNSVITEIITPNTPGSSNIFGSAKDYIDNGNITISGIRYSGAHGYASHAEGFATTASGDASHAEGVNTIASGNQSHAEGKYTNAAAESSHAEGEETLVGGKGFKITDFNIGSKTYTLSSVDGLAVGDIYSIQFRIKYQNNEGDYDYFHQFTRFGKIIQINGLTISVNNIVDPTKYGGTLEEAVLLIMDKPLIGDVDYISGSYAHAEGYQTKACAAYAHAEGKLTTAFNNCAHAEGHSTVADIYAHAEGVQTMALGRSSHTEGRKTETHAQSAHAEGESSVVFARGGHAEGYKTVVGDQNKKYDAMYVNSDMHVGHAEGFQTKALSTAAHAEGRNNIVGAYTYAVSGTQVLTNGTTRFTLSSLNGISVNCTILLYIENMYIKYATVSQIGETSSRIIIPIALTQEEANNLKFIIVPDNPVYGDTIFDASNGHAEGENTVVLHKNAHTGGLSTNSSRDNQTVIGEYNANKSDALLIVGNGESDTRTNALEVNKDGTVTVGAAPVNPMDVVNKSYLEAAIADALNNLVNANEVMY